MTRYDVAQKFLPYLADGKKISDDYMLNYGVIFSGKYGYIVSQNAAGRIRVDDRILPVKPLLWRADTEEVIDAPVSSLEVVQKTGFSKKDASVLFFRRKDLLPLAKEMTPKREHKSIVTLNVAGDVFGITTRKNEIVAEKKFTAYKNCDFNGKIEFNLFNFRKAVLEIFSDYDIIGIRAARAPIMFGRRLDNSKPAIDFIFKEGINGDRVV